MLRIDAHHHLWRFNEEEYGWLEGDLSALRRDFLADNLQALLPEAGVSGTVVVQARQSQEETDWLLRIAAATPSILGVVGWLPLRDSHLPALLEGYAGDSLLKGLRHVLQAEPSGFMDDLQFRAGIGALAAAGLPYDVLIRYEQLEEATRLVDDFPNLCFAVDHLAKPPIAANQVQPWAPRLQELAKRPNTVCKVSGMVTEADPKHWTAAQLKPYFDIVLEAFTPARLMAGSDWPVILADCSYSRWWNILCQWVSALTPNEQADILGRTAVRTYRLDGGRPERETSGACV